MTTRNQIEQFLAQNLIAVAGVSRNPKKFGFTAFKEVMNKGLNVIPINPHAESIDGIACYPSVDALPDSVKSLWILTPKSQSFAVAEAAIKKGIPNVWIQQMSETPEVLNLFKERDVNLISKECLLMFYKPHSIHKFHRAIKKFFGRLPK